ncbi:hypothetical protein HQ545_05890 [Candidatus Woesearchaeota archaeon]|nr:hypothetical protein [Candidatus Woesearchaeota archaeon]
MVVLLSILLILSLTTVLASDLILNTAPVIENIDISASSRGNTYYDYLTANWETSDEDGDDVYIIEEWYVNNMTMTLLHLPFENSTSNTSSTSIDYSDQYNNCDVFGAEWYPFGGSDGRGVYNFDGIDDYMNLDTISFDDSENFTLSLWYKGLDITIGGDYGTTLIGRDKSDIWANLVLREGYVEYIHYDLSWQHNMRSSTMIADDRWHQIVFVNHDTKTGDIWIDGEKEIFGGSTVMDNEAYPFIIDSLMRGYDRQYTQGMIDEVRVYGRALSDDSIQTLYQRSEDTISPSETITGEVWHVCVTPNDGSEDGIKVCSESITIQQGGLGDQKVSASSAPDLELDTSDITFSDSLPRESQNITIFANVSNLGTTTAENVTVQFIADGSEIGNATINISGSSWTQANVTWLAQMGQNNISVYVDPDNDVAESNETNNNASILMSVTAYHIFYGDTSTIVAVGNGTDYLLQIDSQVENILVSDSDSSIDFNELYALGKTNASVNSSDDFEEADQLLGMTGFPDSINITYSTDGSTPKSTRSFDIIDWTIEGVPVVNSTNSTSFVTGILWDASDDDDGEYDSTDSEDLVFITSNNEDVVGFYGTYDYEIKVPALLRSYKGATETVDFYIELP